MMKVFKNKWLRFIILIPVGILTIISIIIGMLYLKQDAIVQRLLASLNESYAGRIEIEDSHISIFQNFPYISIDLEQIKIYENKEMNQSPIVQVKDGYIGFDLWTIIAGQWEIKKIKLSVGSIDLIQDESGEINIIKAFSSNKPSGENQESEQDFHLNLKQIELHKINVDKINESSGIKIHAYIPAAQSKFSSSPEHILVQLKTKLELTIIKDGDTTFIKNKHLELKTQADFLTKQQILTLEPTVVKLEGSEFNMEGSIDLKNDMLLDLYFSGNKPNFDLFIALAPEEVIPVLRSYENQGRIYFDAQIYGKSANGNNPFIEARFGCENAYFNNYTVNKKLDELNFAGYFTNGANRDASTMRLEIKDFTAKPEAGKFSGNLIVENFNSPEINLQLESDFELDFLAKFFNLTMLKDIHGKISLTMNFRDIIDLKNPEKAIEKLNESYFTQLKIENLGFSAGKLKVPLDDLDLYAEMQGHEAIIKYCNVKAGNSKFSIKGNISDLPAIIHHTDIPVTAHLDIKAPLIDLFELTGSDTTRSFDEQIQDASLSVTIKTSAKAVTESPNLPVGEFFIDDLYAKLNHYAHRFHDFHADIFIKDNSFSIVDFSGMIDQTDFHFSGSMENYAMWLKPHPEGKTFIEYNLNSNLIQLKDLLSYKGKNYVPEEYRDEEFRQVKMHGFAELTFHDGFESVDATFDKLEAKMKLHPLKFEKFKGNVHYEKDHIMLREVSGKMGHSDFLITLHYYLGKNEKEKKRNNLLTIQSKFLDLDELIKFNLPAKKGEPIDHDKGFNIYELPFTDMRFEATIDHLRYQKYMLHFIHGKLRTTPDHKLYVDDLKLQAAGGNIQLTGYFDGSDPQKVYINPTLKLEHVDIDKLMFKFDNFGQDHLVSENLHGELTATITGKIRMHTDLVPKIDESDIQLDFMVFNGRIENYAPLKALSDFFKDKNLNKILFDTLKNTLTISNGMMTIPDMFIQSSLGFFGISGKQRLTSPMQMDYAIRIPWKLVTQAVASKLFGRKQEEIDPDREDAIQYADQNKKIAFIHLRITGEPDNYKISLGKAKKN